MERQLKEVEREKERELNALRREKRDLLHTTQMVPVCLLVCLSVSLSVFLPISFCIGPSEGHFLTEEILDILFCFVYLLFSDA